MTSLLVALLLSQVKTAPCRPTVSCTAELVPQGHLEAELGVQAVPGVNTLNALVKLSLLDWLQVQAGSDALFAEQAGQWTAVDGAVGVIKARLISQGDVVPTISISARLAVPTHPPLPALQGTTDLSGILHLSKDLGWLHLDANAMFNTFGFKEAQGQAALAASTSLPGGFGVALETHSSFGNPNRPNDGGVRGVLTFAPSDTLVFDVGGDVGFFPTTRAWSVFFGLVFVPTAQ